MVLEVVSILYVLGCRGDDVYNGVAVIGEGFMVVNGYRGLRVEVIMVMVNDFVMKALVKGSLEMELNKVD